MGVKNNFSQAVSELIGISRNVEPEHKKEEAEEQAEEVVEAAASAENVTEGEGVTDEMADMEREAGLTAEQKDVHTHAVQNPKERIRAMLAAQQQQQPQAPQQEFPQEPEQEPSQQSQPEVPSPQQREALPDLESPVQAAQSQAAPVQASAPGPQYRPAVTDGGGGVTTIARGTVLIGEINSDGDVELLGSVKGKVSTRGDIRANGKIVGDLIGRDIELLACAVQGNIIASGMVTVDGDSVVVGDVKGENFCLDGKIKGNVTVEKEAKFQPKAILAGNVTTASIAMSQGAKIQGAVNIPLSEKETDMSFDIDMTI